MQFIHRACGFPVATCKNSMSDEIKDWRILGRPALQSQMSGFVCPNCKEIVLLTSKDLEQR